MLKAPGSFRGNAIRGCSRESADSAQRTRSCGYRYVLFDCGDVPYRIIDIAVGGVVAVGYRIDQMGACIGSTAAWGVDRRTELEDFTKLSEVHRG